MPISHIRHRSEDPLYMYHSLQQKITFTYSFSFKKIKSYSKTTTYIYIYCKNWKILIIFFKNKMN